jgi:thymidylate kinase
MIIVLEGPDGAGKTTLATKLVASTGWRLKHYSAPQSDEEAAQMKGMYLQDMRMCRNAIFDRSWYSDMAYGPVMRGKAVISAVDMYELERALMKQGGLVVYCTAPVPKLWQRCKLRGETYLTEEQQLQAIVDNYNNVFNIMPHIVPVTRYEYNEDM